MYVVDIFFQFYLQKVQSNQVNFHDLYGSFILFLLVLDRTGQQGLE